MPTKWRTIKSLVHKIRLHGRRGKGTAESFSRKQLRQAPQKEGGEILCDPGWYVQTPDVQNKRDDNTHTHGHGDGNGAGAGTGVEVNEEAQEGNGDGNGGEDP